MATREISSAQSLLQLIQLGNFSPLPQELVINIFKYLDIKSVAHFGLTCRALHQLQESESLWKFLCIRDFFSDASMQDRIPKPADFAWKTYYQNFESFLSIPFPGKKASFKLRLSQDWSICYLEQGADLIRTLSFESETKDSLIEKFNLLGYENGRVALSLQLSPHDHKVIDYFNAVTNKDNGSLFIIDNFFILRDPDDIRKAFRVLKEFNQIPENYLDLAEKLSRTSDWRLVTPLSSEETEKETKKRKPTDIWDSP